MKDLFDRLERLDVGDGAAQELLTEANALFDDGDFAGARSRYHDVHTVLQCNRATGSSAAEILGRIADCNANLGFFSAALEIIDRAILLLDCGGDQQSLQTHEAVSLRDRRAFYLSWMGQSDLAAIKCDELVRRLRQLVRDDASFVPDLARSLDHLAEILERGHRIDDAARAASESTELRRMLSLADASYAVPFLRSLITHARLVGFQGEHTAAVGLCDEANSRLSRLVGDVPEDIEAQILACRGRNQMTLGRHIEGESDLEKAAAGFQRLARCDGEPTIFMDAEAEVLLDLGRQHLYSSPETARDFFLRACELKKMLAGADPHPSHAIGYYEAYLWLTCSELAIGSPVISTMEDGIARLRAQRYILPAFPRTALEISKALTTLVPGKDLSKIFWGLADMLLGAGEIGDDDYHAELAPLLDEFQGLWLRYFIDDGDATAILVWLTFAHGHRLSALAHAERQVNDGADSPRQVQLDTLRRKIHRLDLEMDEIISGRNPSFVQRAGPGRVGMGQAAKGAGDALAVVRDDLYRQFVFLRNEIETAGARCPRLVTLSSPAELLQRLSWFDGPIAVWCVPKAFDVDRSPLLLKLFPGQPYPTLESVPALDQIAARFAKRIAGLGGGRSGLRGARSSSPFLPGQVRALTPGRGFWAQMNDIWDRICSPSQPIPGKVAIVTHSVAHNLPWLGSCPDGVELTQFPSLNFMLQHKPRQHRLPGEGGRPLLLFCEENESRDPLGMLYHAPLEAEIVRLAWPGAVFDMGTSTPSCPLGAAGVWVIGHGLTDSMGQPLIGVAGGRCLFAERVLSGTESSQIDLLYASTCFLGSTSDRDDEPIGLSSIAALHSYGASAAGAIAPVDDLGAALLAALFHHFWRKHKDPREAFDRARRSLLSGAIPDEAADLLRAACAQVLPRLVQLARSHSHITRRQVAECYPELTGSSLNARQYQLRKQGTDCLDRWQCFEEMASPAIALQKMLLRLKEADDRDSAVSQIKATASHWAWFG